MKVFLKNKFNPEVSPSWPTVYPYLISARENGALYERFKNIFYIRLNNNDTIEIDDGVFSFHEGLDNYCFGHDNWKVSDSQLIIEN